MGVEMLERPMGEMIKGGLPKFPKMHTIWSGTGPDNPIPTSPGLPPRPPVPLPRRDPRHPDRDDPRDPIIEPGKPNIV